jgi:trans-aconitate methyltransferase
MSEPEFDAHAHRYEADLARALSVSGEDRAFFARGRVRWLARCLAELGEPAPRAVLDFGCGDGFTSPLLRDGLGAARVLGVDVSSRSLERARSEHAGPDLAFAPLSDLDDLAAGGAIDLAYCNGVFHHIAPDERPATVARVRAALRPGGLFSLWENNPWNPATHYVMSRCEFDRDARLLSSRTARRLLAAGGFEVVRTDFRFIFPRALRALRRLEDMVYRLPLGTQYQVLGRRT